MIRIKFAHKYFKMPDDYQQSALIEVIPIQLEKMSNAFRVYDTQFQQCGGLEVCYPLPDRGDYMVLMLLSESGRLWTTIRRRTPAKEAYYKSHIGEIVECVVQT